MSPSIPESAISAVAEVLRSGMLVQGRNVEAFERELAEYLGVRNVVALSNGTATLHLALLALGVKPGDEVIVPAFSYIATANVVEIVGAKCVFVDIEKETFNIDVAAVEAKITPNTKAIIPVHEFGLACNIGELMQIADRHNIPVIEDAACALGATEDGKFTGTFGAVGSFSLHPRKAVTSGEGGFLTTGDDDLARQYRILRNHGIDPNQSGMDFVAAGLNYRMTDFQAALVRPQFETLDENIEYKSELAKIYFELLGGVEKIQLPKVPDGKKHTWQTFHILLADEIDREDLIAKMKDAGVGTNFGAQCIPSQTFYQNKYNLDSEKEFPNALRSFNQGLALPLYEKLTAEDIVYVANILKEKIAE